MEVLTLPLVGELIPVDSFEVRILIPAVGALRLHQLVFFGITVFHYFE